MINRFILFNLFLLIALPVSAIGEPVYTAGNGPQLFVDDLLIAEKEGVTRQAHACEKLPAPVLEPEMPWEQDGDDQRVYIYGTVLKDEKSGQIRMWYNRGTDVLYATSEDGLHWDRPELNLIEINGSRANNCVLRGVHSPSVVYTPDAPEETRYVMLGYARNPDRGYHILHSPDGLHWERFQEKAVLEAGDTCTLMYDEGAGGYFAFHKRNVKWRGHERRTVYLSVSPDARSWPTPKLVMAGDEIDDRQVEAEGGLYSQFYNMSAFPCGDQYLGFVTHFRFMGPPERKGPKQSGHDGPIDVYLVHSRDGRQWDRCEDRSPVIPNGPYKYDAGCILGVANGVIRMGDEVWTYYTAITTTHGGFIPEKRITIAVAKWRLDGFVSLDAGSEGGRIQTVPLKFQGDRLYINAAAETLTVAVLDASGSPLPGYGHADCLAFSGDSVRHAAAWKDHDTLPAGKSCCLEFRMKNAQIYSFAIQ